MTVNMTTKEYINVSKKISERGKKAIAELAKKLKDIDDEKLKSIDSEDFYEIHSSIVNTAKLLNSINKVYNVLHWYGLYYNCDEHPDKIDRFVEHIGKGSLDI